MFQRTDHVYVFSFRKMTILMHIKCVYFLTINFDHSVVVRLNYLNVKNFYLLPFEHFLECAFLDSFSVYHTHTTHVLCILESIRCQWH